ncbi:LysR family transcriptional regulator [Streptomyces sp. NPDC020096]
MLLAIAEGGGAAAAARVLGHTPSAVSQQLNRLERTATGRSPRLGYDGNSQSHWKHIVTGSG